MPKSPEQPRIEEEKNEKKESLPPNWYENLEDAIKAAEESRQKEAEWNEGVVPNHAKVCVWRFLGSDQPKIEGKFRVSHEMWIREEEEEDEKTGEQGRYEKVWPERE